MNRTLELLLAHFLIVVLNIKEILTCATTACYYNSLSKFEIVHLLLNINLNFESDFKFDNVLYVKLNLNFILKIRVDHIINSFF